MCLKSSCLQAVYTVYLHLSTKLGAIRDLLWSSFDYRTAVSAFGAVGCGFDGFCMVLLVTKGAWVGVSTLMVGKIGISAQTSSTSVLFCCAAFFSNGWNSSICGHGSCTNCSTFTEGFRFVSELFPYSWDFFSRTFGVLLVCTNGDKCSKMNVLQDPCSFTKLLSPETRKCWTIAKHS